MFGTVFETIFEVLHALVNAVQIGQGAQAELHNKLAGAESEHAVLQASRAAQPPAAPVQEPVQTPVQETAQPGYAQPPFGTEQSPGS